MSPPTSCQQERQLRWPSPSNLLDFEDDARLCLQKVLDRRAEVRKYVTDPAYKEKIDTERRERKKAENPDPPINPFSIIIPLPPFGMQASHPLIATCSNKFILAGMSSAVLLRSEHCRPEYDDGERFDLRSPYAEKARKLF